MTAEAWRDDALCADFDPELWFPGHRADEDSTSAAWHEPRAICKRCPMFSDCRAWVAENPQEGGMFAAMTPHERLAMTGARPWARKDNCHRGHDLNDPGNLYVSSAGKRRCKTCSIENSAASNARRAAKVAALREAVAS